MGGRFTIHSIPMTFEEYQQKSRTTAIYPDLGKNIIYPTLGLVGEAGEVAEKVKKVLRDHGGAVTEDTRARIADELGDVLWYLAQLTTEFGLSFDALAVANIAKLASRQNRGVLHGDGDQR